MAGHIYRDVILEQHERLFRGAMGAEFLFTDDNALPPRANISIGGYHPYGLASILTELESNRACLGICFADEKLRRGGCQLRCRPRLLTMV
ncbi:HTH_Tnp_Tc3_2 domain-containing protein [Trichonephila clavipes]|nr:HTH_Tnp_Tc3_2 domain-containing protein [Trichonephila clavipes]